MIRIKKLFTILLTIAMVASLLPATAFAANTATTMRLAKTQGTVTVTNATGKNVTKTNNMKLYNGYKIKTGAKSYAWISLDDTKVAKLDANSTVEVQKKGKDLTLYLSSGNMFFNVKKPLNSGENLQIKTSTMTTGIRGTSGCVRIISPRVTEVHLLTGEVLIYVEHPEMGISKSAMLKAGQKATSMIDREALAVSGEMAEIVIEQLRSDEICGICAKEIAEDPELLDRIRIEAPHLLPEQAAAEADERLAADEAEAEEKQAAIDAAIAEQVFPEEVDPYFEQESGGGGGGGGGSAPARLSEVDVATWGELLQALIDYNNGEDIDKINLIADIDGAGEPDTLPVIGDHGPLILNLGTNTLNLNATLVNEGELTITNTEGYLTLDENAPVDNNVRKVIRNTNALTLQNGTIAASFGAVGVQNNGTFNMNGGAIRGGTVTTADGVSTFVPSAGISYIGITNYGTLNYNGGTIDVLGGSHGIVTDRGTANLKAGQINVDLDSSGNGGAIGVVVRNSAAAELSGTAINVTYGTGMQLIGGETAFTGGSVIAESGSIAVSCEAESLLADTAITSNIRSRDNNGVFPIPNVGYAPTGYRTVHHFDENYWVLEVDEQAEPEEPDTPADPDTDLGEADVLDWEGFVGQLIRFNGNSGNLTINLTADLDPSAEELEAFPMPEINNNSDNKLIIDLGGHNLGLPTTMKNTGANEIWFQGEGNIQPGTLFNDSTLISNAGEFSMYGGALQVPHDVIGVNNSGTFSMFDDANITITYSTGIHNTGTALLYGGTIEMVKNDTYADGGEDAIAYCGYSTEADGGASLTVAGTAFTIPQDITYTYTTTDGTVDSPPVMIYNETGNTVTFSEGTMSVGSGVGISNSGDLEIAGGTFNVDCGQTAEAAGAIVRGIEGSGTLEMHGGSINVSRGVGIDVTGETQLNEGSITLDSNAANSSGVQAENTNITIDGINITAEAGQALGVYAPDDSVTLNLTSGSITANGTATAVNCWYSSVTMEPDMIIRAQDPMLVYTIVQHGAFPDGYEVNPVANGGYYYLEKPANEETAGDAATFAMVVNSFDGTEETNLTLESDITVDDVVLEELGYLNLATAAAEGEEILTIDLKGYTLTLDTTLSNNANMIVTDTAATHGTINGDAGVLVANNSGTLTWDYGNMTVGSNTAYGLVNYAGEMIVGNGTQSSATLFDITGSGKTGIHVSGGTVTLDGVQIETAAAMNQNCVSVAEDATLEVEMASLRVESGNNGIVNRGTVNASGLSVMSNSANTGTGINSTQGDVTVSGGSFTTDLNPCVQISGGTFEMTAGSMSTNSYSSAAVEMMGGEANLTGGSITVKSDLGDEKGVYVGADAAVTIDGVEITVNGSRSSVDDKNYAVYDNGGTVNVVSGTITAISNVRTADENGDYSAGNAYALYSTGWADVNIEADESYIYANCYDRLLNPEITDEMGNSRYTYAFDDGEGYYFLTIPS